MMKKWVILFLSTMLLLTACHSPVYNQTVADITEVKLKSNKAFHKSDDSAKKPPSLLVKQGLYVDTTPINLAHEPSWLSNHIVIRGDQLPFSYYSRTIAAGAGVSILTKYQVGLDSSTTVSLNYSGTIKGALDLLASKAGFVYSINKNGIYWQAFITRTYDIAFMPGGTDYLMGNASGTGATGTGGASAGGASTGNSATVANYVNSDASADEYSSLKGTLSVWKDLDASIKQLLSPDGKVVVSESTTSVTVRDKPSNVELIGKYIANLNHALSRQVLVKVQVLDIQLENDYTFGINWGLIARAFNKSPFVLNGNYGTPVSITSFTAQPSVAGATIPLPQFGFNPAQSGETNLIPSYTILFNALNQQGKTSVVSEPRVVCLNNQVSVIRIVQQQGYLASVQNTTLAGGSGTTVSNNTVSTTLTPGTLITGLTLYILPKIMKDNIYLQVNADLSTAGAFTQVSSAGPNATTGEGTFIQIPNVTQKHFNQRSMIRSGDTLILSGFRQVQNIANANQLLTSQSLGGKGSQQLSRETIVLITPIILPGSA